MIDKKSDRDEHLAILEEMKTSRVPKAYLTNLVTEYKMMKAINPDAKMPDKLADVVLVIIGKMGGSSQWRGYTEDWKEEFRGRAIEHILRYAHNFDPIKMQKGKDDPYNYFAMIILHAFIQSKKKLMKYHELNVPMNHEVLYKSDGDGDGDAVNPNADFFAPKIESLDWGSLSIQEVKL
jgi:hypothetical protein